MKNLKFVVLLSLCLIQTSIIAQNYTWTQQTNSGSRVWHGIASSSDGTKLVAGDYSSGYIYTSTNSGVNWTAQTSSGTRSWHCISSSSNGTKLAAAGNSGYIYTSTNSGINWSQQTSSGSRQWEGIVSSSDGTNLASIVYGGYIYTSTNSGVNWTQQTSAGSRAWHGIATSSDGTKLVACVSGGYIYTSTNSGINWTQQTTGGSRYWEGIASSSDGIKLAALADGGDYIYTSTNSGVNWTAQISSGRREWWDIASSSDGTKLAAIVGQGYVYVSTNSGVSWSEQTSGPNSYLNNIACSSDGTKLVIGRSVTTGYIYTGILNASNSISTSTIAPSRFCQYDSVSVPFTITGTFNSGNIFTVQLSDSSGSFANPTSLSTLNSTSAGTIGFIIPLSITAGTGYRIRVISSNPAITGSNNGINITINALPPLYSVTGGGSYCQGGSGVTVGLSDSRSGISYQLKRDGVNTGTPVAGTGIAISFGNQTLAGTYSVVATNTTTTCSHTMWGSVSVSINPIPTLSSVTGGGSYCSGGTGVVVGLSGSQTGVSYQLKKDGVNSGTPVSGTGNAISFGNQTLAGAYTVLGTNTTTNCFQTMTGSVSVSINPLPTPNISGTSSLCSGSQQTYSASAVTGTNQWYVSGGSINGASNQTTANITWGNSSSGTLKLVQKTSLGCKDSSTTNIIIKPLPIPIILGTSSLCAGSNQDYTASSITGTNQWYVTGGAINGSSSSNAVNVTWGNALFGSVQLVQTTLDGCENSTLTDITINPLPKPAITGKLTVEEQTTEAYTSSKATSINNIWTAKGGSIQGANDQQNVNVKWGSPGNGMLYLEQTNQNTTCSNIDSIIVKINSAGTFSIYAGTDKEICQGNTIQIGNANPVTGGKTPFKFKWTPNTDLSNDAIPNPIASPKITTTYRLTVTDSRDSIRFADVKVTVNSLPVPDISGKANVLTGDKEQYTSVTPGGIENLWNCVGGTITGSKIGQAVEINWQTNGNGKVILEQTITATGCKNSDTLLVNVTSPGVLSLNINGSASICSGDTVQIGNANPTSGGMPPYRFKWTPNTNLINDTLPNPLVYPKTLTKYTLTVKDSRDSTATAEVNVQVNPLPSPKITDSKPNPTAGETITYSAFIPNGTVNKWTQPKGGQIIGVDNAKDVLIKWLQTGNGLVSITQTITTTGCKKSDTLSVNVLAPDKLIVFAGTDKEICERETIQLGSQNPASGGKPPFKFVWTPSTGLSNDTLPNPEATPLSTTTYILQVSDSNGDTASSKVTITVNPLPKSKISGKNIVFLNAKESYSVPTVSGNSYKWFIENGTLSGKDTDASISVTWDQNKTGKVKIVQTSDKGCVGYDSISVSVNAAGDCISTKDIAIPKCYIIPGYETVKLGIVKFKNICEENVKIANVEFQSKSGQFTIKDTMPDILSILKPMNEAEFVVAFKPKTSGADEAFITLQTDKGEIKTSKITSFAVQGNDKTSLTVLKIIPSLPKGNPGTFVDLEVRIIEAKNVDIKGSMAFITSISWNSQVLQYLGYNRLDGRVHKNSELFPEFDINSFDYIIELEGNARTDNMQLAEINTKALLGAYPKTDLIFRDFKWLDTTIKAEILNDGVFELDLCEAGGVRMMKLSTSAQIETLSPNPVTESAYMKYSLLEDGQTSISIINILGITKKVLFASDKKAGNYELIFSTEDLESGIYYIVLQTHSNLLREKMILIK